MAAGIQARQIFPHRINIFFSSTGFPPAPVRKGKSFFQYSTATARTAPSWTATRNTLTKSADSFRLTNSFRRIICPVLLMGSHSVSPSTIPNNNAFNSSILLSPLTSDFFLSH